MKKLLSFLLALTLSLSLATFALADDDGGSSAQFDPEVTVEENGSTMTVTLSSKGANDEILASKQPTLTVACDYARADVTDPNGVRIESTLTDGKISFTVTMGGEYTITRIGTSAPSSKPADNGKTDDPQPDDGSYVNRYPDVQEGDWYSGAVQFVTEEKLMSGTGKGFEPNAATTRAMLWTILARMDSADTNSTGAWYAAAQDWAVKHGVSDGTSPDGKITREQLATMLYRYAKERGMVKADAQADLSAFADGANVSPYAAEAMRWAVAAGIMNGMDGSLVPQGEATRAQMATMLIRKARCIKREQNEKGVPLEGKRNSFFAKFRYSARSALYDSPEALPFSFFRARATIRCAQRRESPRAAGGRTGCQTRPRRAAAPRRRDRT